MCRRVNIPPFCRTIELTEQKPLLLYLITVLDNHSPLGGEGEAKTKSPLPLKVEGFEGLGYPLEVSVIGVFLY